jgi:hypothetical protein
VKLGMVVLGVAALAWTPIAQAEPMGMDQAPAPRSSSGDVLGKCSAAVLADTRKYIDEFTNNRRDLKTAKVGAWGTADTPPATYTSVADDPGTMEAIRKAATLDCDPGVDLNDLSAAPENVRTAASILTLERWNSMIRPDVVGTGGGNGPAPSGFATGEESLTTFLNIVGRFPYLCGEKGTFKTVEDACQREMASIFAHAAQETGGTSPRWESILTYTREQNCYPNECPSYNKGAVADYDAPADAGFFGRGMKQLSYPYNYFSFSADWFGDPNRLIQRPDEVAQRADTILGSAVWFYMSPQPPKPSMHSVMVGTYTPRGPANEITALGLKVDSRGIITDRFNASNSLINGAVECSPEQDSGKSAEKVKEAQQVSINRFKGYDALLTKFGVERTPEEAAIEPGTTRCSVANSWEGGVIWANPALAYQPKIYVDAQNAPSESLWPKVCPALGYQSAQPLSIISPGVFDFCVSKREGLVEDRSIPAPQGLRELWTTNDAIALTWDRPRGNLAEQIVDFDVTGGLGFSWFVKEPVIVIDNLSAGVAYTFEVRARTKNGKSPPATISAWTLLDPVPAPEGAKEPSEPRGLKPTDVLQTSVTLNWQAPADDGGSAVTGYRVAGEGGLGRTVAGTSVTIDGLQPGVEYTFWVRAENSAGLSSAARVSVWTAMEPEPWPGGLIPNEDSDDT